MEFCHKAYEDGAELAVFPELSLIGYPPKDLLLRKDFLDAQITMLDTLAAEVPLRALIGAAIREGEYDALFNAVVLCENKSWRVVARKCLLPNYNVFDEKRYFQAPANISCQIIEVKGKKLLLSICEDAWAHELIEGKKKYTT